MSKPVNTYNIKNGFELKKKKKKKKKRKKEKE